MREFDVEETKGFTIMSNYHLKDMSLSFKAKGLLSMMLSLKDDWNYSINGLVAISKESKKAVQNSIKELELAGYVRRTKMQDAKGKFYYKYEVFMTPRKKEVSPQPPFGCTDKGCTEKAPQLNTNKLNTNKYICKKETPEEEAPKTKIKSYEEIIKEQVEHPEVKEALIEFTKMRMIKKNALTNHALELCIKKLRRLSQDPLEQKEIIENSLRNGWNDFRPLLKSTDPKIKPANKFNNFSQRENVDFKELERKLTGGAG